MSFNGIYGHLSTLEAAKQALIDIDKKIPEKDLNLISSDLLLSNSTDYDVMRLQRTIEGLQMTIWLNGGTEPWTRLPKLFDYKKYKGRK